jgi:hypothetical protein
VKLRGILASLLKIFEMVEEVGPNLGRPHSAPLGDGLFEFRTVNCFLVQ